MSCEKKRHDLKKLEKKLPNRSTDGFYAVQARIGLVANCPKKTLYSCSKAIIGTWRNTGPIICCDRLQVCAMESAVAIDRSDPSRQTVLEIIRKIVEQCPKETRNHASKLAGSTLPPESETIPRFFRNNPEATDRLEQTGSLKPLPR